MGLARSIQHDSGDEWIDNMAGFHKGRVEKGEECFNMGVPEILEIQKNRGKYVPKQSVSESDIPTLLYTPDGSGQAIYWQNRSKWCPAGTNWTLHCAQHL